MQKECSNKKKWRKQIRFRRQFPIKIQVCESVFWNFSLPTNLTWCAMYTVHPLCVTTLISVLQSNIILVQFWSLLFSDPITLPLALLPPLIQSGIQSNWKFSSCLWWCEDWLRRVLVEQTRLNWAGTQEKPLLWSIHGCARAPPQEDLGHELETSGLLSLPL